MTDGNMSGRAERAAEEARGTQAEWLGMLQTLAEQIQRQQQTSQQMVQEMMDTYSHVMPEMGDVAADALGAALS